MPDIWSESKTKVLCRYRVFARDGTHTATAARFVTLQLKLVMFLYEWKILEWDNIQILSISFTWKGEDNEQQSIS